MCEISGCKINCSCYHLPPRAHTRSISELSVCPFYVTQPNPLQVEKRRPNPTQQWSLRFSNGVFLYTELLVLLVNQASTYLRSLLIIIHDHYSYSSPSGSGLVEPGSQTHFCSIHSPKPANLLKVSSTRTRRPYTPWVGSVATKHSSVWHPDVLIFTVTGELSLNIFAWHSGAVFGGPLVFAHRAHPLLLRWKQVNCAAAAVARRQITELWSVSISRLTADRCGARRSERKWPVCDFVYLAFLPDVQNLYTCSQSLFERCRPTLLHTACLV